MYYICINVMAYGCTRVHYAYKLDGLHDIAYAIGLADSMQREVGKSAYFTVFDAKKPGITVPEYVSGGKVDHRSLDTQLDEKQQREEVEFAHKRKPK